VVVSDTDNWRAPSNKRQEISKKTREIQTAFFISTTIQDSTKPNPQKTMSWLSKKINSYKASHVQ